MKFYIGDDLLFYREIRGISLNKLKIMITSVQLTYIQFNIAISRSWKKV